MISPKARTPSAAHTQLIKFKRDLISTSLIGHGTVFALTLVHLIMDNLSMYGRAFEEQHEQRRNWYVVYTKPQKEEVAEFHLQMKGIEVFHPKLYLPQSSRRGKRVFPLFPNYLFVRISLFSEEYQYVTWSRGIKRFVSFSNVPAPLDEKVIYFLKQQANPSGLIFAKSNLKPGQEVQIEAGPFKGLVGIIQEPPDAKGRVKVLMTLLSRQVKVEVPAGFVRSGWVPPSEC